MSSVYSGRGFLVAYIETEITCPICEQVFDCAKTADKKPYPMFNMKCPKCKGKITISLPIMGGRTRCWETECPKSVKRLETETPIRINGIDVEEKPQMPYDDEEDAYSESY